MNRWLGAGWRVVNSGQVSVPIKSLQMMYKRGHENGTGANPLGQFGTRRGLLRQKVRLLVQDNAKKGFVDFDFAVVLDET
jgi:hypothetical protein